MKDMRRKGVSPVIATLLLIVIAVVAAVLAYIWVSGYMGRVTPQAEAPQLQERIKIDAVEVDADAETVTIYVANIGDVNVTIASAYVLTQGGTSVCSVSLTEGQPVPSGTVESVEVTECTLKSGETYVAKAVTSRGVEATYTFTAP